MIEQTPEGLVLALETTAPQPGAALAGARGADVRLLAEKHLDAGARRAEGLAACARKVLDEARVRAADLSALAVVDGPGSYTSLRIGLGLARGLALLESIPVAAIGALELVAESARAVRSPANAANAARVNDGTRPVRRICALLDAGPAKAYAAGFEEADGTLRETFQPVEVVDAEIAALLANRDGRWLLAGDAALAARFAIDVCVPSARAGVLAVLGARRFTAGAIGPVERVLPRYVGATGARPNLPSLAEGRPVLR